MGQQPPNDTLPPAGLYPPHQPDILRDRSARISRARSRTSAIHGRTDPTASSKVAGARPDIPHAPMLVIHWPACRSCARSEEHTSELQSLMRISYAVFCLKQKTNNITQPHTTQLTQ